LRGSGVAPRFAATHTALQHNLGLGGACVVTLYQV
jgi:sterol carrier protein 2